MTFLLLLLCCSFALLVFLRGRRADRKNVVNDDRIYIVISVIAGGVMSFSVDLAFFELAI